jgi:type IV pilus assembly protein PilC
VDYAQWVVEHTRISRKQHESSKIEDTLSFFHQLSTLISSGTPLLQSLKVAADQCESRKLQGVLSQIISKVSAGSTFYAAAAAFPDTFEFQWLEAIRTGEVTGKMAGVLVELNKQVRDSRATMRKIKGSLTYPMVLICVAIIAMTAMLWLVVPTFAKMFKDMGAELPAMTQFVVDASNWICTYGHYVLGGVIGVVFAFRKFVKTEAGRRYVGGFLMVLPTIGELVVEMAMYRFASNAGLLLKSGVPMMEALGTLRGIFQNNPYYRDALERVQSRVGSGRPLHAALEETGLFLPMLTSMVKVGEESGQLGPVMEQISPYYKEKMENMIMKVTKMLEPIIVMGMGVMIAGLMLSIYMPMFDMSSKVR